MKQSFPKAARLLKRRQFQRLSRPHAHHVGCWIIIDVCSNSNSASRLGITVSKRYGKAHDRNRFKRIVREAYRLCRHQCRNSIDINVKPRAFAKNATMWNISEDLLKFLVKANEGNPEL